MTTLRGETAEKENTICLMQDGVAPHNPDGVAPHNPKHDMNRVVSIFQNDNS